MCNFGGGGSSGGNNETYYANIERDRANAENARVADERAAAEAEKQRARDAFNSNLSTAITNARPQAESYWQRSGIDPNGPWGPGYIDELVNSITRSVPDLDPNPASYFNDDAFAAGINRYTTQGRDRYTNDLNSRFAPGFEKSLLPDTSINPIVASILGDQTNTAYTQLDYNKKRGLLNDTGYAGAKTALDQQGAAARSTLNDLANSVLGTDRQHLLDIKGDAGNLVSSWDFGEAAPTFDSYYKQAQDKAASDLAGLEGSIRGAVGNTNYFDVPTALSKGGILQGPINLTTQATGFAPGLRDKEQRRGLNSSGGVF